MKLGELKTILYSHRGCIQFAILFDSKKHADVASGSIDYIVETFSDEEVKHIEAFESQLLITI